MNPLNLYAVTTPNGTIFLVATSLSDALTGIPSGTIATGIQAVGSVGYATAAAISALQSPSTALSAMLSPTVTSTTASTTSSTV